MLSDTVIAISRLQQYRQLSESLITFERSPVTTDRIYINTF